MAGLIIDGFNCHSSEHWCHPFRACRPCRGVVLLFSEAKNGVAHRPDPKSGFLSVGLIVFSGYRGSEIDAEETHQSKRAAIQRKRGVEAVSI